MGLLQPALLFSVVSRASQLLTCFLGFKSGGKTVAALRPGLLKSGEFSDKSAEDEFRSPPPLSGSIRVAEESPSSRKPYGRSLKHLFGFSSAYVLFGSVGVLTSVACFLLSLVHNSSQTRRLGQCIIHRLFSFFVWYIRSFGLLDLRAEGLHALRGRQNFILASNHPSLLDAVFIAAHLPNVFCLMKASLVYNVVLCGQSKLAGYVNNESGLGLIKKCQSRIQEGSQLLVFPEGTRTRGNLGSFKMGFALLSVASKLPIQTVIIRYSQPFLGKGWSFFHPPRFPLICTITPGREFYPDAGSGARELGRKVEDYIRSSLDEQ